MKVEKNNTPSCQQTLVYRFLQMARWLALILLLGIGTASLLVQYLQHRPLSWIFFAICAGSGGLLFWIGTCLLHAECAFTQKNKRG